MDVSGIARITDHSSIREVFRGERNWVGYPHHHPFINRKPPNPADFVIAPELIGKNTSLAVVIVIVLFWNYFGNKLWTYRGTVS